MNRPLNIPISEDLCRKHFRKRKLVLVLFSKCECAWRRFLQGEATFWLFQFQYCLFITPSFTGRGWLPVCLIGLIGMLNSKTLKLSSQQSLQLPSSWTPTQYLHYRSAIWVTLCVFTQMPVMLTLNLKKHDSSQFISEIQYGKDFVGFYSTKDKTNLCLVAIRYQR